MTYPKLFDRQSVAADTDVFPSYLELPGMGLLPVNSFLIRSKQPVLVDTGIPALAEQFETSLSKAIDLDDLRWIWITHMDADHVGALNRLLVRAKKARLVTTYLGLGKMSLHGEVPMERVYLLNPGQSLDVGDRQLIALRPPTFDAPETTALFDTRTRALFSSDSFGAIASRPDVVAQDISAADLERGMTTWTTIDAPWIHNTPADVIENEISKLARLDASMILSTHLPPALGMNGVLFENLRRARTSAPFVGPDQAQLMQMAMSAA